MAKLPAETVQFIQEHSPTPEFARLSVRIRELSRRKRKRLLDLVDARRAALDYGPGKDYAAWAGGERREYQAWFSVVGLLNDHTVIQTEHIGQILTKAHELLSRLEQAESASDVEWDAPR